MSFAATRWVLAVVAENRKHPVSVATPVYRQSAMCGVMSTPISRMTRYISSAAAAAVLSSRVKSA